MTAPNDSHHLSPALVGVLETIADWATRERFHRFFAAAGGAVGALGDVDLLQYEKADEDDLGLSVWEILAPTLRDTFNAVNALLEVVSAEFPEANADGASSDLDAGLDAMFGEDATANPGPDADPITAAVDIIHSIAASLAKDVQAFGVGIKQPSLMSERWKLLDHIAQFRGKARSAIGEMVFLAARSLAEVNKEDVVPHYKEDTNLAIKVRRGVTMLRRDVTALHQEISAAKGPARREASARLAGLFAAFCESDGFVLMRMGDKRTLWRSIAAWRALLDAGHTEDRAFDQALEGLVRFLESLSMLNAREHLIVADRMGLQRLRAMAEQVVAADDEEMARGYLGHVLAQAERLLGRDAALDDLVCAMGSLDADTLGLDEAHQTAHQVLDITEQIPLPT